jgi:hypothetical protein
LDGLNVVDPGGLPDRYCVYPCPVAPSLLFFNSALLNLKDINLRCLQISAFLNAINMCTVSNSSPGTDVQGINPPLSGLEYDPSRKKLYAPVKAAL